MLLYYVRHGDPIYEPDQLTALGHDQAEALAGRLALCGLERVYCSTSTRARQTAAPLCGLLQQEPVLLDWCNEGHAWQELTFTHPDGRREWCMAHLPTKRLFAAEEVRRLGRAWYTHPAFAGTRYQAGMERIQWETDAFLANLGYQHDLENNCFYCEGPTQEKVALVAHAGVGAAILSCILDIPFPIFGPKFNMGHTGVTVISFPEERVVLPEVLTYSNDSHLYLENLPTRY